MTWMNVWHAVKWIKRGYRDPRTALWLALVEGDPSLSALVEVPK